LWFEDVQKKGWRVEKKLMMGANLTKIAIPEERETKKSRPN